MANTATKFLFLGYSSLAEQQPLKIEPNEPAKTEEPIVAETEEKNHVAEKADVSIKTHFNIYNNLNGNMKI